MEILTQQALRIFAFVVLILAPASTDPVVSVFQTLWQAQGENSK